MIAEWSMQIQTERVFSLWELEVIVCFPLGILDVMVWPRVADWMEGEGE